MKLDRKKCACLVASVLALSCTFIVPKMSAKADEPLPAEGVAAVSETEIRYTGPGATNRYDDNAATFASDISNEKIYYTDRQYTYYTTTNGVPLYTPNVDLTNSCGATGGAIIAGFYDKYYENLIPNYTSYYPATGKYKNINTTPVDNLMSELYTLMRTNVDDVGVNESDCCEGLETYVTNKGYSLSYTSIKNGSGLNMTACQNAFRNNKPILLFCDQVGVVFVDEGTGYDNITRLAVANQHIMVAYGYYQVRYYNGSTNFRTDTYFDVATGLNMNTTGWVKVDSINWLDNGYIVSIS